MGFRSYIRQFFGRNFDAFPSFRALLFERGGGAVSELRKAFYFSCLSNRSSKSRSSFSQEETLAIFWSQF